MRTLLLATAMLLPALVVAVPTAHAQSNPSADQIIRALRPTGPVQAGTRGLRPAAPTAAVPAPATPAAAAAPVQRPAAVPPPPGGRTAATAAPLANPAPVQPAPQAAPSIDLTVQFASGSAELTAAARRTLDELGQALSSEALGAYRFRIEGHTDTTGSRSLNLTLSQERAAAVAAYLHNRFGVAPSRLEPVGRGQDALKIPTPDQTPEPRNRRVQVINIGA